MSSVIWKQVVEFGEHDYPLPLGSEIVSFGVQHGAYMAWFICAPEITERLSRTLIVTGTGHPIPHPTRRLSHHATVQDAGGFVWHLLEVLP